MPFPAQVENMKVMQNSVTGTQNKYSIVLPNKHTLQGTFHVIVMVISNYVNPFRIPRYILSMIFKITSLLHILLPMLLYCYRQILLLIGQEQG